MAGCVLLLASQGWLEVWGSGMISPLEENRKMVEEKKKRRVEGKREGVGEQAMADGQAQTRGFAG